jgi:hypothetical protein
MLGVSVVIVALAFLLIKVIARQGKEYELPDIYGVSLQELESHNPLHFKYVVIDSVYHADKEGHNSLGKSRFPKSDTKFR